MKLCKRLFSLGLSVLLAASLAACGSSEPAVEASASESSSSSSEEFYNPVSQPASSASSSEAEEPSEPEQEIVEKLEAQKKLNKDTVAYLSLPNTGIEDFVVQAKDNDYYLRRNNLGSYEFSGCYYADYRNKITNRTGLSQNTVIYGHNLDDNKDGVQFAKLLHYLDLDYAKEHPYIYLTVGDDEMIFKIFAVFYTNWRKFDYIQTDFQNPADFNALVKEAKEYSEHNFNVDVASTDKIITLSTCTYKFGGISNKDQRYVVMGRLLRSGETVDDTLNIVSNPSHKVPTFETAA